MRLSKDAILGAEDLKSEEVEVPEWGGSVLVRGLTGRERDDYETSLMVQRGGQMVSDIANARAKLVARCVVDDDGQRVFDNDDIGALGGKSGAALARVFDVAARLSGLGEDGIAERARDFPGQTGSDSSTPSLNGSESLSGVS